MDNAKTAIADVMARVDNIDMRVNAIEAKLNTPQPVTSLNEEIRAAVDALAAEMDAEGGSGDNPAGLTGAEIVNFPPPVAEAEIPNRAPRVTLDDVGNEIEYEFYFTAADGVIGASNGALRGLAADGPLRLLTVCAIVLKNGFTVTGESACASPENFDAEIGQRIARQKAVEKVWPLLGFRLRDKLAAQPWPFPED